MKAIVRDRYGPPEILTYEDVPTPVPGDNDVLVRVVAASVNTADIDDLTGTPRIARIGRGLRRPNSRSIGLDMAGRVESVGRNVTRFAPGDEVWADLFSHGRAGLAEYVSAPETAFTPKPAGVSFEQAAATPHSGALALQALHSWGGVRRGDRVLINGAGGCVGPFAIQIARSMGAEVTGVDHGGKVDLMRKAGANHVIDYTAQDVTRNGINYDRIVDIAANRFFLAYRGSLTPSGVYVQVARSLGGFLSAAILGSLVSLRGDKRMGVFNWEPNRSEHLDLLGRMIEDGELNPIIDRTFDMADGREAVAFQATGGSRGKVVITTETRS